MSWAPNPMISVLAKGELDEDVHTGGTPCEDKADRGWGDAAEAEECQQSIRYRREDTTDSPHTSQKQPPPFS